MQTLRDYNFTNKRVLVRCDFNVPISNNKVVEDFRIVQSLQTIKHLQNQAAKVILLSHLGRPGEKGGKEKLTLRPVAAQLERLLREKVQFIEDIVGPKARKAIKRMKPGQIILLENLRLHPGETSGNPAFVQQLVALGEVFVQDAFSVCHRDHASVTGIPKILPHFVGFALEKEIAALSQLLENPKRPLVVIIGGAKVSSKTKVLQNFLEQADHILLGGMIVNMILRVKGICVGRVWPEDKAVAVIENLKLTNPKLHLPIDGLASPDRQGDTYVRETGPGNIRKEEEMLDIGPETASTFAQIIRTAKTIFWSGPLGLAENEKFAQGTEKVAEAISRNNSAFKVVGGGETIAFLRQRDLLDKFSYVSTGGSALLDYLAGEKLPGLEALEN